LEPFQAIVLRSLDYKESSKILYLYTEKGNLSVIAHGVKKLSSNKRFISQNGTLVQLTVSKGTFPILKEGSLIQEYPFIKQDIICYTYMNHMMELVQHVINDDADHPKMFQFLQKLFTLMNQGKAPDILSFIFELKLLYFVGYGLNFMKCGICDKSEDLVFHVSNGGLVCKEHLSFHQQSYHKEIYDVLKLLYYIDIEKHDIPEIEPTIKATIRHIIDMLYDEFISFQTKSRAILKQIEK
jgi:DNA repair protein RecO (recombination protein O)